MIHVAYRLWGGDGFFAKMCGTSMLSMFENTCEKVTVHIMHNDRLTPDNRGKFCYIAGQYNQRVEFHNVEEIAGDTLKKFSEAYPVPSKINASWYPLVAHEVFPDLNKIILFGADLIFNHVDIGELWNTELNPKFPFAAVAEFTKWGEAYGAKLCYDGLVKHLDYFNADVFLAAPKFFADNFELILEGCRFCYANRYTLWEQDILNYLFSTKYQKLPGKFNLVINWEKRLGKKPLHLEEAIYHYAGGNVTKPSLDTDDIYSKLYLEYFLKTPWANVEMFGNVHRATENIFRNTVGTFKRKMLSLTNLLPHCERAFFADKKDFKLLKHVFEIKENELIIDSSASNAANNLLRALEDGRGKKIFFLLIENYWRLAMILRQNNFVEGKDFFNAVDMLSEQYGIREDFAPISKTLLQEM